VSFRASDEGAVPVSVGPGPSSGTMGAVADEILDLRQAFDEAELCGDADRLNGLLADDFLSSGEQGYQLSRGSGSTGIATSATCTSRPPSWTYGTTA
jgi:hypothetical protein